ncbi:cytochrome P450, partial [Mycena crocata]
SGSVILRATYGYQTALENDRSLSLAGEIMTAFSSASQPGAWAVDILPWLRHLPSWLPGTGFKKAAAKWDELHIEARNLPLNFQRKLIDTQDSPDLVQPNFVSTIMSESPAARSEDLEDRLLWASSSLYRGGADTTVAAISSFFLAMALYPEVQAAAQAEIDMVVTDGRLPQLSDHPSLPYIELVMREALWWNPTTPLALPHILTKDDAYRDYHLAVGSNCDSERRQVARSILRLPIFPEPEEFRPERFKDDKKALDTVASIFGFGRRTCPGVNFAEPSMFIAIATARRVQHSGPDRSEWEAYIQKRRVSDWHNKVCLAVFQHFATLTLL